MLGIDTNVVIRLVISDDAEQTRRGRKLVDQALGRDEPVLVSLLVLLESEWVLRSRYGFNREALLSIFRRPCFAYLCTLCTCLENKSVKSSTDQGKRLARFKTH
jgi:predicted nucleic acid-binding protein